MELLQRADSAPGRGFRGPGDLWARHGGWVLWLVVAHALLTAGLRLLPAFDALVFVPHAAIDLLIRSDEVTRWFGGEWIYGDEHSANYPPASYPLLWPLIGWLPENPMRVLYGVTMAVSLSAISFVALRASGAERMSEKAFMLVFLLPLGATQITVWIGQLGLHVTAALLVAAALLLGSRLSSPQACSWRIDLAAASLLVFSLVKPTLAVPVVAGILILTQRWRPALFAGVLYVGLTLVAATFQESSALALVREWLGREEIMNLPLGSVNIYLWLHWMGFEGSMLPFSLVILAAFVIWAWRQRRVDPLMVLAVGAVVARLWVHHRAFDDVLLVVLAIALFRMAKVPVGVPGAAPVVAASLLAAIYFLGHAPWHFLSGESPTLWLVTEGGRTVAWLAAFVLLIWYVHRRHTYPAPAFATG